MLRRRRTWKRPWRRHSQGVGSRQRKNGHALQEIVLLESKTGNFSEASKHLERALAIRRRVYGENDPRVADTLSMSGAVSLKLKDYSGAKNYSRKS